MKVLFIALLCLWTIPVHAIDIISPKNCTNDLVTDHCTMPPLSPRPASYPYILTNCKIPMHTLTVGNYESAVPLRTVIRGEAPYECRPYRYGIACLDQISEQNFCLKITFENNPDDVSYFYYLTDRIQTLRRADGGPITALTIEDRYYDPLHFEPGEWYTFYGSFSTTCEVNLDVTLNEPDVNSKADAWNIVNAIDQVLLSKIQERDLYQQLVIFSSAYFFIRSILDNFYIQLSNDTIQNLRGLFLANKDVLKAIILDLGGPYTQDQRLLLFDLYLSMFSLGDPADWKNPDGSTKTIEQYLGSDASDLFNAINSIGNKINEYNTAYQIAAQEVEGLQNKLELAKIQLAGWL